jgi:hypothetical protein
LFRLDTILSPKLVPIVYAGGLLSILLWAVGHLFLSFGRNFGDGLWGLLEIAAYGTLMLIVLRIACEVLLIFFKANETAVKTVSLSMMSTSIIDDVKDALHDIAEDASLGDDDADFDDGEPETAGNKPVRRTAKRSPKTRA